MKNKENTGRLMWFDFSDSENILIHSHAEPELFYVLEGEADVTADEDKIHLEKDDFIVINANRPHSVKGKNDFLSGFIHMAILTLLHDRCQEKSNNSEFLSTPSPWNCNILLWWIVV